jgi:hypothetical protein
MPALTLILEEVSVLVVEATIPEDMTITEWRRRRLPPARPAPRRRLPWRPWAS